MILLGLTGSIGMGKSTTLGLFAAEGCPVWSADAAVHRLYAPGGEGVGPVEALFPGVTVDGGVDRGLLSKAIHGDPSAFARLEGVVHPLVREDRKRWLDEVRHGAAPVAVVDVPLLFETGAEAEVDAVVVVSAPPEVQRERVLARPGMTQARLDEILALQLHDAEKRERADFVIDTSKGLDAARDQVRAILAEVTHKDWAPRRPATLFSEGERGE